MDKEERKQYNKVYYSVNKDRILADLCQKSNVSTVEDLLLKITD